jgi:di/tricarboxylate transporter
MTIAPPLERSRRAQRVVRVSEGEPAAPRRQWPWLLSGAVVAFAIPFLFADLLGMNRDIYYGLYMLAVAALCVAWARRTRVDVRSMVLRRWRWGVGLGVVFGAVLTAMVLRTEDATSHPHGIGFVEAILWRGVLYGVTDGVLLSVLPILIVFAIFSDKPLMRRLGGKAAVGALALAASLAFTAVYHLGYPEFRGEKLRKPIAGDLVWSVPTLFTLSPFGSPIAHAGLHVSAVVHSYGTDTFLPPHAGTKAAEGTSPRPDRRPSR